MDRQPAFPACAGPIGLEEAKPPLATLLTTFCKRPETAASERYPLTLEATVLIANLTAMR